MRFYTERLGFNVLFEASGDGHSGLVGLEREGMRINLDAPMDGHGRRACVSLEVNDVDALFREWSAKIDLPNQPVNEPWGSRTFGFQDPDENTIFVIGPIARP